MLRKIECALFTSYLFNSKKLRTLGIHWGKHFAPRGVYILGRNNFVYMDQYMVVFYLPPVLNQEFMALIPAQRKKVNELMRSGTIISYTLAKDRSMKWAIVAAHSEEEVENIMETLPLTPFTEMEIHELFFHNSLVNDLPVISMN